MVKVGMLFCQSLLAYVFALSMTAVVRLHAHLRHGRGTDTRFATVWLQDRTAGVSRNME
jgi:hypothetical protein